MEDQPDTTKSSRKIRNSKRLYAGAAFFIFLILIVAVFKLTVSRNEKVPASAKIATVRITANGFEPATLSVKQGTKVTWTNTDSNFHQVASNPYPVAADLPGLKSEILNNAQTYTYVADTAGSFGYHDQIRPTINGTITVKK